MKFKVFAVWDKAVESYSSPFTQATIEAGIRMWRDLVMFNTDNNRYKRSPQDYSLHYIGEYDDDTGELIAKEPLVVKTASEVVMETTNQPIEEMNNVAQIQ